MTDAQTAAMRAYLRQWIAGPWFGPGIEALRVKVDGLMSRAAGWAHEYEEWAF
jgi:hypothetical protein